MHLDHIAISGRSLAEAADAVETALGVALQPGGQHPYFGTHNRLLGLADGLYLEAIAIDPSARKPDRPRWFDLDRFDGPARLTNWICQTQDLPETLARLPQGAGTPVALSRGDLRWQMAVPENGRLPYDNVFPAVMRWDSPVHPSAILAESGCVLTRLVVIHPEAQTLHSNLMTHLTDPKIEFEPGTPGLVAEFDTPHGKRVLR